MLFVDAGYGNSVGCLLMGEIAPIFSLPLYMLIIRSVPKYTWVRNVHYFMLIWGQDLIRPRWVGF